MESKILEHFRARLIAWKAELEALSETARESTRTVELDQSSVGRLSRMDAMQGQQMALATSRRRAQQLQRVKAALARVDSGDYGECLICGEEIGWGRLNIDPAAPRCIACAEG